MLLSLSVLSSLWLSLSGETRILKGTTSPFLSRRGLHHALRDQLRPVLAQTSITPHVARLGYPGLGPGFSHLQNAEPWQGVRGDWGKLAFPYQRIKGLVTTDGWKGYMIPEHELVAPKDATIVAKLKAAGAIIIGQTNMPGFATSDTNRSTGDLPCWWKRVFCRMRADAASAFDQL